MLYYKTFIAAFAFLALSTFSVDSDDKRKRDDDDGLTGWMADIRRRDRALLRALERRRNLNDDHAGKNDEKKKKKFAKRPNIILLLTDDQDVELGSLQFMPKLNRYLREEGAYFENGYASTPMCCPSRSSMLTGLYAHNHNVLTNNDNCSSTEWKRKHEPRTFATYLSESGYKTGYFGKYLNKYDGEHIPVGWKHWMGLVRNSRFYNYTVNLNGEKVKHGMDYEKDYFPDLITNSSISYFRKSKEQKPNKPVMMVLSYPGPHGPEDSAPQYQNLFFNVTTHHTPAYDYTLNSDKQWILQVTDRMDPVEKKFTDFLMTKRLQTLQSIDSAIEKLIKELDSLGELDNTYIFYTSDHGYHLGQFGLVKGKAFPFDVDIKVPFFVRGPGIEKGSVRKDLVVNIDLAPTFLDLAGIEKPEHMDGEAIFQKSRTKPWRDSFLVERGKMTRKRYNMIKGSSSVYNEIPLPSIRLNAPLLPDKPKVTKRERLEAECQKPRYQSPCRMYQERKCVRKKNGDWKMQKCHRNNSKDPSHRFSVTAAIEKLTRRCACSKEKRRERRKQMKFIHKHVSGLVVKPKFLDDDYYPVHRHHSALRRRRKNKRYRRDSADSSPAEKDILDEIAEEEIDEVDIIIEDIADDLDDLLQQQKNESGNGNDISSSNSSTFHPPFDCRLNKANKVDCSLHVYKDKNSLKTSRSYINEQIKRYRAQLFELKEIRKHLKSKMPNDRRSKLISTDKDPLSESSFDFENRKSCKCNAKTLRELRKLRVMESRRLRKEKIKRARLRRRLRKKELRRRRREKKLRKEKRKKKLTTCNASNDQNLNCFSHDNDHWKTPPLWNDGSFCACTNSNTNTYWCVRTINATHNYLYCEFVSGIITYYDLNVDPYQLRNIYQTLNDAEINHMHKQLRNLSNYSAARESERDMIRVTPLHPNKNRRKRQKKFNVKYGPFLPPVEAYFKRR